MEFGVQPPTARLDSELDGIASCEAAICRQVETAQLGLIGSDQPPWAGLDPIRLALSRSRGSGKSQDFAFRAWSSERFGRLGIHFSTQLPYTQVFTEIVTYARATALAGDRSLILNSPETRSAEN